MRILAALGSLGAEFDLADLDFGGLCSKVGNVKVISRHGDDVVVVQVHHLAGVRDRGRGVARQEVLPLAQTENQRRAATGANQNIRFVRAKDGNTIGADGLSQRRLNGPGQEWPTASPACFSRSYSTPIRWARTSVSVAETNR